MILPEDENGFAIPSADLLADQLTECTALDLEAGDPAEWPDWTDADVWEPSDADRRWLDDQAERRELERFYGCNMRFAD